MNADEIRNAVHEVIASIAPEADRRRIRPDRPLRQQVDLDSMDWLNVFASLHERLQVDIPPAELGRLTTIDAIVDALARRLAPATGGAPPAAEGGPAAAAQHVVDGNVVTVRPIGPADAAREAEFVQRLSAESRYTRFMSTLRQLPPAKLKYLTDVDQVRHVALVATTQRDGREVQLGVARYIVDPSGCGCEFAVAVDDAWQGTGLAGILMHALMDVARRHGLARMEGVVLTANRKMLAFARQLGFSVQRDLDDRETVRVARTL